MHSLDGSGIRLFEVACLDLQAWAAVMSWYVAKRRHFEEEIRKYSDPPSDALLPELPPHARSEVQFCINLQKPTSAACRQSCLVVAG